MAEARPRNQSDEAWRWAVGGGWVQERQITPHPTPPLAPGTAVMAVITGLNSVLGEAGRQTAGKETPDGNNTDTHAPASSSSHRGKGAGVCPDSRRGLGCVCRAWAACGCGCPNPWAWAVNISCSASARASARPPRHYAAPPRPPASQTQVCTPYLSPRPLPRAGRHSLTAAWPLPQYIGLSFYN